MMLMDCLSAGRGISLPATNSGGAKQMVRLVGAYSAVRQQFLRKTSAKGKELLNILESNR